MSILLADIDATCAALGYNDGIKYQADPDAIQGLKHLIWILRRDLDNHEYRRHIGRAKVLQTDLVPMLPEYIEDDDYADVLIRLLVVLTNPTLLLYRDGAPKDNHGRKVFLELIDILQGYKEAFTKDRVWAALATRLHRVLDVEWNVRREEQGLLIERVLVLIRNVLQVPANTEAECRADNDASVHDQVIWALHQSGVLDLILYIASSNDENQYHLHALEILSLLYREQTAESLADASMQRSNAEKHKDELELIAARKRERQKITAKPPPGRHSRFGGTFVVRNLKSISDNDAICHQSLQKAVTLDFDGEKKKQKKSFRIIKEETSLTRRSAFSVRLCLREYCIEILRSGYNTLVRQVRRVLERNTGSSSHDDSYLLWAIKFFMEFNRLSGLQLHLVSESMSVQCFHWVLMRIQHDMDMMSSDKKNARLWSKRLHVGVQTFKELLQSLVALQKVQEEKARSLYEMLLNNVCYVLEYRETILTLLMSYSESNSTKAYLRDVMETANIFIKMMEKFCKEPVVVQEKKRRKAKSSSRKQTSKQKEKAAAVMSEDDLENKWIALASDVTTILGSEIQLPEEDHPIPFDGASDKTMEEQKEECIARIYKLLHGEKLEKAVLLLRAAREVWPENDTFGCYTSAPEDEFMILREIFLSNIAPVKTPEDDGDDDGDDNAGNEDDDNDEIDNEEEEEISSVVEKTFKFEDFAKRLINPKVVRSCTLVLQDWEHISTKSLKSAVTILYRIAYELKCVGMLFQAVLFRVFQEVFRVDRDAHNDELRRLGVFVVRKFVEIAPNNPKIYAELLFYKNIKDANELETGYCDSYDSGTKVSWTEEQEEELRHLFLENQNNPQTDQDVIDWIIDNLIDKNRTRRAVLRKLREMGLEFKLPTKKSYAGSRKGWLQEEDELLTDLYYEHRLNEECLKKLEEAFVEKYNKNQIIKRMLQLHLIADRSEIVPKKKGRKKKENNNEGEFEFNEEEGSATAPRKPNKSSKPKKRTINKSPIDVPAVQSLISQLKDDFEEAITWLQESLQDASEDVDQAEDEEDGVPLVALGSAEKDAMESKEFHKLLLAMGIQPPIDGMESYWRIPVHLKADDLTIRAKILAGEEVEVEESQPNESSEDEESEEEDYLDAQINKRKQQMDNLVFNNSDNEDDDDKWEALKNSIKSRSKAEKKKKTIDLESHDNDDDNDDIINVNSEQLRERLAELSDSENESDNGSNQTIIEASNKTVVRRRNVIDSDDDEDDGDGEKKDDKDTERETEEDQTDHQHSVKTDEHSNSKTRKRSREAVDDEDKEQSGLDEEDMFLKRKKTETEITKRRRIAVIDDDDDDE